MVFWIFVTVFPPFAFLYGFLGFLFFVLWIVLMVKASQHEMWKLPVVGDLAERYSR